MFREYFNAMYFQSELTPSSNYAAFYLNVDSVGIEKLYLYSQVVVSHIWALEFQCPLDF